MELIKTSTLLARRLTAEDEPAFQELLLSIYEYTYPYQSLYKKNGYADLVNSGNVACFGQFNSENQLIGHTGFFINFKKGYAISGLSMRVKSFTRINRSDELETWEAIFAWLSRKVKYVHQNTTTYHLLAQMYADRILKSIPTGFVFENAIGVKLLDSKNKDNLTHSINALTQTNILHEEPLKTVYIDDNKWANWIILCFEGLNRKVIKIAGEEKPFVLEQLEYNAELDLEKRVVCFDAAAPLPNGPFIKSKCRTDLIYFPCDAGHSYNILLENEYIPVGVCPNPIGSDEIVFQFIPKNRRADAISNLKDAKLFAEKARLIIKGWIELCEETI